jgi:hypothetical protein
MNNEKAKEKDFGLDQSSALSGNPSHRSCDSDPN